MSLAPSFINGILSALTTLGTDAKLIQPGTKVYNPEKGSSAKAVDQSVDVKIAPPTQATDGPTESWKTYIANKNLSSIVPSNVGLIEFNDERYRIQRVIPHRINGTIVVYEIDIAS